MNTALAKVFVPGESYPTPRSPRLGPPAGLLGVMALLALGCSGSEPPAGSDGIGEGSELYRAPPIPNVVDGVVWEAGDWEPHLPAGETGVSWGNHRAVITLDPVAGSETGAVPGPGAPEQDLTASGTVDAVVVTVPWRRHDPAPETKGVIVVDAATGQVVSNATALRIENTSGDVVFQPNPGSSTYHVYYMPWQSSGGYYPTVTYPTPNELRAAARGSSPGATAGGERVSRAQQSGGGGFSWVGLAPDPDRAWEARVRDTPLETLPRARVTRIQSVDAFHAFFPMEVIATPEEMAEFWQALAGAGASATEPSAAASDSTPRQGVLESGSGPWTVVPEYRDYPIRMRRFIPRHWVERGRAPSFSSPVLRDEAFTFQLGVVAGSEPLHDLTVTFDGFPDSWNVSLTCFNLEGIDEKGAPFTRRMDVPAETIQPLWIGVRVPTDQPPGPVEGVVTVTSSNLGSRTVEVSLDAQPGQAINSGFDEPDLQTRLFWLNSTLGTDPDFIIEPFTPVEVDGHTLSILGRRVELGPTGFPNQILSFFTPELTGLAPEGEPVLARPLSMEVITPGGYVEEFSSSPFTVRLESRGRARWTARSRSDYLDMTVDGALEYEGMLDVKVTLVALSDAAVDDIGLPVSLAPDAAEYMLGLGQKGGRRPPVVDWRWAVENHQEGVWLGGIDKGLQYVLRDEDYVRPLNTNFYQNQPLNLPPSWYNGGLGGILILEEEADSVTEEGAAAGANGKAVTAYNYSGPRTLLEGDTLHFNVRFLITPFKPVDTRTHFNTRFVHQYVPVDSVRAWGGTVVNIHHANEINPYINYPFFNLALQRAYIDEAHEKGIKVKLYNTIRELTYKAHELFALRSLGDEILNDGEGGGHSWMQEHLENGYHSAWHAWRVDDAAMLDKGTSRWTNYYIEGLSWLAANQQIDGLYLDDIAFSRETVKRLVNVLHQNRPEVVIDLHSANQFNVRDGFINSAMLYMEHFPFISRLWFGEYFEYDLDEDYWVTEVSGLPFGLMGEMLQDGGHPYRGLLYGMTARKYGDVDPRPVWAMMNDFGIADSEMRGYWLENSPVTTDHPRVLATTYRRPDGALVVLASWSQEDEVVALEVDWGALGLGVGDDPGAGPAVRAFAPAVDGLQDLADIDPSAVQVAAERGLFVILRPAGSFPPPS